MVGFLSACSNSQVNPLIGDYKSDCDPEKSACSTSSNIPMPSFERKDNSDIILSKLDSVLELSGRCDVKSNPDSQIQISIIPQGSSAIKLNTGFVPLIGITTSGSAQQVPVAKCEKGKWAIALNGCANGLQNVGVHRIDLVLNGIDGAGKTVSIADGTISANINRAETCR